ncbi:hypothetical protein SCHPADRAFT_1002972 [Schizopora paradoxa]|uniref:Uncharacterized protein n=1 Tax=Schizopora paradoxa TaxID=27342 RepID=A0A0H2RKJ4_9AGAM|nr:hypothetical protein SCHPADRAFT_1002972 [Schizopora paradoxa]
METLWDVLDANIPDELQPKYASKNMAAGTRDIPPAEANESKQFKLHAVVYYGELMHSLIEDGRRAAEMVDIHGLNKTKYALWRPHVVHGSSSFMLPPFINSEMDTTAWFNQVLARPALAAVNLVQDTRRGFQSAFTATTNTAPPPFIISARKLQKKPITDEMLMKGGSKTPTASVNTTPRVIIELKTGNALNRTFIKVSENRIDNAGRRIAIPFVYPDGVQEKGKTAKILVQLWSQMVFHECDYGILSSYHETIFVYRKTYYDQGKPMNILFLSETYEIGSSSLSPMFSLFLHTLETTPTDIPVPPINRALAAKFMSDSEVEKMERRKDTRKKKFKFPIGLQTTYTDQIYHLV